MLDLKIVAEGKLVPLFDIPAVLGRAAAARELGRTIDAMIAFMDDLEGDADLEEDDPGGGDICDEPHDAEEDACEAGDDGCGPVWKHGLLHWGAASDGDGI